MGTGVDVIYTDFSKAFDKVNHSILLSKLQYFCLTDTTIQFIQSYLTERTQYVEINSTCSEKFISTSGVPQGSILGPLLFTLFIDDVVTVIQSNVLLFADDLKIFTSIKSLNDCQKIQMDLNNLYVWCKLNDMVLNIDKCLILKIKARNFSSNFNYCINDIPLEEKFSTHDLGITINSSFTFNSHIIEIVNKSLRILGFIMRVTANFTNSKAMISIYSALVRTSLEYVSPIWNPNYNIYINGLERVQRKFTRFLNFKLMKPKESYNERLHRYKLDSLETRRKVTDELTLFKILNNYMESEIKSKLIFNSSVHNTRNPFTFNTYTSKTNYRRNSPSVRLQMNHNHNFNNLNLHAGSITIFKNCVRKTIADNKI